MKNIFKKQNLMPVCVLGAICLLVAVLMAVINSFTAPKIADYEAQKVFDSLRVVLDGHFEELEVPEGAPKTVTAMYKVTDEESGELKGNVVTIKQKGYAGDILLTVGIDTEGKTTKVVITAQGETHGKNINPLLDKLSAGVTADNVADVEAVSGATVSSTAIKSAIADAFKVAELAKGGEIEQEPEYIPPQSAREEAEILTLAGQLVSGSTGFTAVDYDAKGNNAQYLAKLYKENSGKGYVAYVVVMSRNYIGSVESEALIHIENNGKVKAINKLACNISPANPEYGYTPPTTEEVDAFYKSLEKTDSETIGNVELVTNATNTTTNVVNSVKEALGITKQIILKDMPTSEEEIKTLIAEWIGANVTYTDITPEGCDYVKRLYKLDGGQGYIAYTANFSEKYGNGRLETETLVHIGNNGKIKDLKKITWTNSNASGRYTPPTLELVDAFYTSLKNKSLSDLQALAALENNDEGKLVTKATVTSKDLLKTLIEALSVTAEFIKLDMPTPEEEIEALIAEFLGADVTYTDITPDGCKYVKKFYRLGGGKGYVAYTANFSEKYGNGRLETETLIHIGNDGKIINMKKMTWTNSDASGRYTPPALELVDAFYASLNGKGLAELQTLAALENNDEGKLVTKATITSKDLLKTLIEALEVTAEVIKKDLPRSEADVITLAQQMAGEGTTLTDITPNGVEFLKRLYRIDNTNNYIAYVVVPLVNEYYNKVETETLIYIADDGTIKDVSKLTWNPSPEGYGYIPPEVTLVDAFYNSLKGKNVSDLKELKLHDDNNKETSHGGLLVTEATMTCGRLLGGLIEAVESAEELNVEIPVPQNNTPRIIGIVAIALLVASVPAVIIIKRRIFR